jgi:hypothetical protein
MDKANKLNMEIQEKAPRSRNKPLRLLPSSSPLKCREKIEEPKKRKASKSSGILTTINWFYNVIFISPLVDAKLTNDSWLKSGIGPMCIFIKEHKESMCRRLEKLYRKQENGLLDLDIECEGKNLHVRHFYFLVNSILPFE